MVITSLLLRKLVVRAKRSINVIAHLCSFALQGNITISVTYGGDPIPKSPFIVNVAPPLDLGKVKVQGLNNSE